MYYLANYWHPIDIWGGDKEYGILIHIEEEY